jgi:isochorismate synthase EntC
MTIADRPGVDVGADLLAALEAAPVRPGQLRSATLSIADLDPIALVEAAREADLEAALWLQPADGFALVGIGRAWAVESGGPDRFAVAANAWARLVREAAGTAPPRGAAVPPRGAGPLLLGGLGFTGASPAADDPWGPFGAASLVLPSLLLARTPDGSFLTASVVDGPEAATPRAVVGTWEALEARARDLAPAPGGLVARPAGAPLAVVGEQPGRAAWDRLVGLFAGAVGRGRLDKVVLARRVDARSPLELDVPNALRRLAAAGPESTTFAFARGASTFLGATPERLVRTEGRAFRTVAIAGSAPRGVDPAED